MCELTVFQKPTKGKSCVCFNLLLFFSDHCFWWASHRLQKPHWSEQSHQSSKNPAVSLFSKMIKPSRAHKSPLVQRRSLSDLHVKSKYRLSFCTYDPKFASQCCKFTNQSSKASCKQPIRSLLNNPSFKAYNQTRKNQIKTFLILFSIQRHEASWLTSNIYTILWKQSLLIQASRWLPQ